MNNPDKTANLYKQYLKLTKNEIAAAILTVAESITSLDLELLPPDDQSQPQTQPESMPQTPEAPR